MEKLRNLDIKTIMIIVLGVALIISFMFGQKSDINTHKDEISLLHKNNDELLKKNDSLLKVNEVIDLELANINKQLAENDKKLANSEKEIKRLKNKPNENNLYVKRLSSHGVSVALSNYIENRVESSDNR